jgi:2-phosphoglycerate kinase
MMIYAITGATGVGKSSLASSLSARYEYVISTDEVREDLRRRPNPDPVLTANTYEVGYLNNPEPSRDDLIAGYIRQRNLVMDNVIQIIQSWQGKADRVLIEGIHIDVIRLWQVGSVQHHHIPMPASGKHLMHLVQRGRGRESAHFHDIRTIGAYIDSLYSSYEA